MLSVNKVLIWLKLPSHLLFSCNSSSISPCLLFTLLLSTFCLPASFFSLSLLPSVFSSPPPSLCLSPPPPIISTEVCVCCLLCGHRFGLSSSGQELHQAAGGRPVHTTSPAEEHLYDVLQWGPRTKVCVRHEFPVHWRIQGNR